MVKSKKYSHQASLKTVYKKLERDNPFTENEKVKFNDKERALIRGIQLRDKTSKKDAMQTYHNYQIEGKRKVKSLNSSVRNYLKTKYPKHGGITHEVSEMEPRPKRHETRLNHKKEVFKFITNKDNKIKNESTYKRVQRAYIKYPNASLGELRHGINSKWSENYRVKNGLSRNYK